LEQGHNRAEVARILGVTRSTVTYHARRLGKTSDSRFARRFDWDAIREYYAEGYTVAQCQKRFGFSKWAWDLAVQTGRVEPRAGRIPLSELLVAGPRRGRSHLKWRLIAAGLKAEVCERCGISEWLGEPLSVALHHVNGDRHDNRLENLQLLCPNCHSQTETYSGRNGTAARGERAAGVTSAALRHEKPPPG
jgi:hypothetical protein